jgi:predicted DNA-binding transcriptional regulator AlpA
MNNNQASEYMCLSDKDISRITGINLSTLRNWRRSGHGPVYMKMGSKNGSVLYPEIEFRIWFNQLKEQAIFELEKKIKNL